VSNGVRAGFKGGQGPGPQASHQLNPVLNDVIKNFTKLDQRALQFILYFMKDDEVVLELKDLTVFDEFIAYTHSGDSLGAKSGINGTGELVVM